MNYQKLKLETSGERFYPITELIGAELEKILKKDPTASGVLHLFNTHTSCGLTISESFDSTAADDLENFLKSVAPRNQGFITHNSEGDDDSPSHMKSILLQTSISLFVDKGDLVLGPWQGIYLCEFRDRPRTRTILIKFQRD